MSALRAFVDRIEGRLAVLLVGDEGQRLVIPREALPSDAGEGSVLRVDLNVDSEATEQAKQDVEDLIDRLKRRNT